MSSFGITISEVIGNVAGSPWKWKLSMFSGVISLYTKRAGFPTTLSLVRERTYLRSGVFAMFMCPWQRPSTIQTDLISAKIAWSSGEPVSARTPVMCIMSA